MNRKYLYCGVSIVVYLISAWIIGKYFTHDILGGIACATPCAVLGFLIGAVVDGIISSINPDFLYTPYEYKVKLVIERQKKREEEAGRIADEASRAFKVLENELLNPYTSLSWKYELISRFCYRYPNYNRLLKESEMYQTWRTDVINWANDNLSRLKNFYLSDGVCDYFFDCSVMVDEITDNNEKYPDLKDIDQAVTCDVEFKRRRKPKDYFEFPGLVWEDEDFDYSLDHKTHTSAEDAFALGIGMGVGLGLADSCDHSADSGDGCGAV